MYQTVLSHLFLPFNVLFPVFERDLDNTAESANRVEGMGLLTVGIGNARQPFCSGITEQVGSTNGTTCMAFLVNPCSPMSSKDDFVGPVRPARHPGTRIRT